MKKKKGTKKRKGFTLIELLVVIAIIGLLATLAVVSMSSARAKARDAKRVSDIRQMATILDVEDAASPNTSLNGCNTAGIQNTRACTGPGDVNQFTGAAFTDPTGTTVCTNTITAASPCQYAISSNSGAAAPKTNDYQICFGLEQAQGTLVAGEHNVGPSGLIGTTCL